LWAFKRQELNGERLTIFNMTMNPGPSIAEYVRAICKVAAVNRYVPDIPYWFLISIAYLIEFILKPFGLKHPFSPVRIRKLIRSNNVQSTYLLEGGYEYQYTIEAAFADWKNCSPEEWQ
jgi:acetoin utilization deacetylase AcuC-like enzyme